MTSWRSRLARSCLVFEIWLWDGRRTDGWRTDVGNHCISGRCEGAATINEWKLTDERHGEWRSSDVVAVYSVAIHRPEVGAWACREPRTVSSSTVWPRPANRSVLGASLINIAYQRHWSRDSAMGGSIVGVRPPRRGAAAGPIGFLLRSRPTRSPPRRVRALTLRRPEINKRWPAHGLPGTGRVTSHVVECREGALPRHWFQSIEYCCIRPMGGLL